MDNGGWGGVGGGGGGGGGGVEASCSDRRCTPWRHVTALLQRERGVCVFL